MGAQMRRLLPLAFLLLAAVVAAHDKSVAFHPQGYSDGSPSGALTAATMTAEVGVSSRYKTHSFTWTNAQVAALGAVTAGDISVVTLPAKTLVRNAYVVITGAASGTTTLTVSVGRTGATYLDYVGNGDAKAAANTVYGDTAAERGANMKVTDMQSLDLPSYTGTTTIYAHFISTGANLSAVTGSSGRVILETTVLP